MKPLLEMQPDEVLEPSWLETYRQMVEILTSEFVRLRTTRMMLARLRAFPFPLFTLPDIEHFWDLVDLSFFETCVMILWRAVIDTDVKGRRTLKHLKNDVVIHCKPHVAPGLNLALATVEFDKSEIQIEARIRDLRSRLIAHLDLTRQLTSEHAAPMPAPLTMSDLEVMETAVEKQFALLCFGRQTALVPWGYAAGLTGQPRVGDFPDLEALLDSVARSSAMLNNPEQHPEHWTLIRASLSQDDLRNINGYRTKFGMPTV